MARVFGFIDGFNLYRALIAENAVREKPYETLKWLDYWKLVILLMKKTDSLEKVFYFSAYAPWDQTKQRHHIKFVKYQISRGVTFVQGHFRPVEKKCRGRCKEIYQTFEEKRTDVNIASFIIKYGVLGEYEKAILISEDSDLVPAIETTKELAPSVEITVVPPIGRDGKVLRNAADKFRHMKANHLRNCQISEEEVRKIHIPDSWL